MKERLGRLGRLAATITALTAAVFAPLATASSVSAQSLNAHVDGPHSDRSVPAAPGDGTPSGAVQWFQAHIGSKSYEEWCEKAVENAYGTSGVWPSAMDHWNAAVSAGSAHQGDPHPPLGAFVYWNLDAPYGHVGIADGNGGFYSSSVNGAIGHQGSVYYFANYLGWSRPQVPHR